MFAFNQASLQKDKGIRMGYQLALESFPLVSQPNGWYRTLGIGASYEKEYGDATQSAPMSGLFIGYRLQPEPLGVRRALRHSRGRLGDDHAGPRLRPHGADLSA